MSKNEELEDDTPEYLASMDTGSFAMVDLHASGKTSGKDDVEYWLKKSPMERLFALELLRQRFFDYDYTAARLQRILEVVKQK
jgi:hypothetical protein